MHSSMHPSMHMHMHSSHSSVHTGDEEVSLSFNSSIHSSSNNNNNSSSSSSSSSSRSSNAELTRTHIQEKEGNTNNHSARPFSSSLSQIGGMKPTMSSQNQNPNQKLPIGLPSNTSSDLLQNKFIDGASL